MPTHDELLPQVYSELRRLAASKLVAENVGQTLQATALVHEAWLKLVQSSREWSDKTHFFRTAATAMRQILIDRARAKRTAKRDGGVAVPLDAIQSPLPDDELLAVDEALTRLAAIRPDHAKLIELRYFANLTADEAAEAIGVSPSTADRMWRYAKAWLQVELKPIEG